MVGSCSSFDERGRSNGGAVIVEFAIVAFGLFIGSLIYLDVSHGVTQYLRLTNAASEALQAGVNFANLEVGTFDSNSLILTASQKQQCFVVEGGLTTLRCGHALMFQRAEELIQALRVDVTNSTISSERFFSGVSTAETDDTVRIRITATLDNLILPDFDINVSQQGQYMFEE